MQLPSFLEIPLRLALLVGGLLVPGSMLLRALRLPWSLAAAFGSSLAILYTVVVLLAWTGGPISLLTLGLALTLVTLAARLVPGSAPGMETAPSSFACFTRMGGWLPLYAVFWLIVAYRLGFQPLAGPDTPFRWSWLGEQMLRFGSLEFYPPRSGDDFVRYFWAESIPPGIASTYAWAYACGGSQHTLWASPVIVLQLLALHELVWRLGHRWGGEIVARRAVLFAAACPLLTWSAILGQETGLTALAIAGIVWTLPHLHEVDGRRWAALAAVFAIAAASAREYGVLFPFAAIATAGWMQIPRRNIALLAAVALPVVLAWPLRVWMLTGNPIHSLNVAGLFPINDVFVAWNDTLRGPASQTLGMTESWRQVARYLLLWAFPAVVGAIALIAFSLRRLPEVRPYLPLLVLTSLLWIASVGYTAGGLFYSLRVLSPVFALLTVTAAYGVNFFLQTPLANKIAAACLAFVLLESLPKTLVLPENPYRAAPRDWLNAADIVPEMANRWDADLLNKVEALDERRRIVSDYVGAPKLFTKIDTDVVPFWSPDIAWLFDATLPPEELAARWRTSELRYFVLLKTGPTAGFLQSYARWKAPYFEILVRDQTDTHLILDVKVK